MSADSSTESYDSFDEGVFFNSLSVFFFSSIFGVTDLPLVLKGVDLLVGVFLDDSYLTFLLDFVSVSLDLAVGVNDELAPRFSLAGVSLVN